METLKRADFTKHSQQCVEVEVPCMHNDNGCPWTGARKSLTSHLSKCPYEAIKGFFVVNETRLSTLYEENTTLRQKLGNAEATIHSLRRDVDTARRALGPWWKSGDIVAHAPMEEFSEPSTSAQDSQRITEQSRWRAPNHFSPILTFSPESSLVSTTYEGGPFGASAGPSSDPALFASYFPSPSSTNHGDPSSIPAHAGTTLAPADPLARHLFPFSSRGPSDASPAPASHPVDRDTTLEGALCGLRGSAVALSGAIDALARRTDVALTTENLRMNEEVGALRAIVHGLRMQVHALITERNGGNPWGPTTTSSPSYYSHPPPPPHPPLMVNSTAQITKL
ncbi:hypothetical protein EW145_g2229 [Phellinidium pouzarii]|uniref:TRAF-type domain-containing protein n=1 Tax=Phellinidium pouzarii TaxID=167371 RepID=A0A4S4LBM4_9AGAM|nr:hypothetical protein EW145_g2229 [Phellinidium pouzarii]